MASLKGVEIFAAGVHRGESWTPADVAAMVKNFHLNRGRVRIPVDPDLFDMSEGEWDDVALKLGHEQPELQKLLGALRLTGKGNTGRPALGRVTNLYREGTKLVADLADVPEALAELIRAGSYAGVSAEIYDDPGAFGCAGSGPMVKAVGLLGGQQPEVKGLNPGGGLRSALVYAEAGRCGVRLTPSRAAEPRAWGWLVQCFAEGTTVTDTETTTGTDLRAALLSILREAGLTSSQQDLSDGQMLQMVAQAVGLSDDTIAGFAEAAGLEGARYEKNSATRTEPMDSGVAKVSYRPPFEQKHPAIAAKVYAEARRQPAKSFAERGRPTACPIQVARTLAATPMGRAVLKGRGYTPIEIATLGSF